MITDAHARLSDTPSLLASRRRLYAAAIGALPPSLGLRSAGFGTLDSPLLRGALGFALAGGCGPSPLGAAAICRPTGETSVVLHRDAVPVVDVVDADRVLGPVLAALDAGATRFLTTAGGDRFRRAVRLVEEGVALAWALVPDLAADLFPHVAMLGVLDGRGDPRSVLSASLREYPGLLMLAEPGDDVEAAEALLHEAAHARFFDMAIVHDLLPARPDAVAPFVPSWRSGASWPLEQAFAALHAYAVLAEFHEVLRSAGHPAALPPSSLLAVAGKRVGEIGAWIEALLPALGRDAAPFVLGLLGRPAVTEPRRGARTTGERPYAAVHVPDGLAVHREAELGRTVVARPGSPARLYVLDDESALVLDALVRHHNSLQAAVDVFAHERGVGPDTAELAVSEIVDLLAERSLLSLDTPKPAVQEP